MKKAYLVVGHVVDRSGIGVAGVVVELWDRDLILDDLLGTAISDANGRVEIPFRSHMFREWVFDRRPDVYVKAYREGVAIPISPGSQPRHVTPGRIEVRIALDEGAPRGDDDAVTAADAKAPIARRGPTILGHVADHEGHGVRFLRVEAWDHDLVFDDLVGTDYTDPDGDFVIEIDDRSHREILFDRRPDLYFKIFDGDELVKSTKGAVLWNVRAADQPVMIELERRPERLAHLAIEPKAAKSADRIVVRGAGFADCCVKLAIDDQAVADPRILDGTPAPGGVYPLPDGSFVALLSTRGLAPGEHRVTALREGGREPAIGRFDVIPRSGKAGAPADDRPFLRQQDFHERRFGRFGVVPEGLRAAQIADIRRLRDLRDRKKKIAGTDGPGGPPPDFEPGGEPPPSTPVPGACNWTPLGPAPSIVGPAMAFSGRTSCIAFSPTTPPTAFLGTAGGGVWRSTDGGTTWSPKTDYSASLAIGAIAIDPNNALRIFAGTGEYSGAFDAYYGAGILRSTNGGDTWAEIPSTTTTFAKDHFTKIIFEPEDATSNNMFASCGTGVYASTDKGDNWTLLRAGSASDVVAVLDESVVPPVLSLLAGFTGSGIWKGTRTGTTFAWTMLASAGFPAGGIDRIAFGQSPSAPNTIYAAFATSDDNVAGVAKTITGGNSWTALNMHLDVPFNVGTSKDGTPEHDHAVMIPAADTTGAAAHTYTTTSAGVPAHTHTIAMTAAELGGLGAGRVTLFKTTAADASGHSHTASFDLTRQTWYNFTIAVHPTDPNTVFLGEIIVWRTTTGDGPWTACNVPHTDEHGLSFEPGTNALWMCSDGGAYRSTDSGVTFTHQNRDLATLEFVGLAAHPQWDAVLLGGTQDNGTHRYSGLPAWTFAAGGDGGFAAIDPVTPTRMYHEYIGATFYRSDLAGTPSSWAKKNDGIAGGARFYAPFLLDPTSPSICYFGGDMLWRSPNHADTWTAVTATVGGLLTAIAVHPTDSLTVYIGTDSGHVFRVQSASATWAAAGITVTDVVDAPGTTAVFVGRCVSDLAVDPAGTVWVTISDLGNTTGTGEFTNDHVYRRTSAATTWELRSNGLSVGNPINSIVIDPAAAGSTRLFCAGDVSVFRTDDSGGLWTPWDEGLPNVPVWDLVLHAQRRLLRAATHGRSVWERPIDTPTCPMVDLYIRDTILDTGRQQPSPDHQPHPFDPTTLVHHWQSPDIKVDGPEPTFQTTSAVTDYITFESLQHRYVRRGVTNRFYVRVLNRGISSATNVRVRGFFADAHAGLPALPADFWTSGRPFTGTPSGTDWTAVGATRVIATLEAAEIGLVSWDWAVPAAANEHSCLLAVVTCNEDAIVGGVFGVDSLVVNQKHVGLKNLHVDDPSAGPTPPGYSSTYMLQLRAPDERQRRADLVFHWGSLPKGTTVAVVFEAFEGQPPPVHASDAALHGLGIAVGSMDREAVFRTEDERCGRVRKFDVDRVYRLPVTPGSAGELPAVEVPHDRSLAMLINVTLPETSAKEVQFDVMQRHGGVIVGGSTYVLRPRRKRGSRQPGGGQAG